MEEDLKPELLSKYDQLCATLKQEPSEFEIPESKNIFDGLKYQKDIKTEVFYNLQYKTEVPECHEKTEFNDFSLEEEEFTLKHEECVDYKIDCHHDVNKNTIKGNPSHTKKFKCSKCNFESKHIKGLRTHQRSHIDTPKTFKCPDCNYFSKLKQNLKIHQVIHKDPADLTLFSCSTCNFKTKHKTSIRKHQQVHRDPSEVRLFECNDCGFEFKWKSSLRQHVLRHRNPSRCEMLKCNDCPYQSIYKRNLMQHLRIHREYL